MASKKQVILPIAMVGVSLAIFVALSAMKKPPEQKPQEDVAPLVEVQKIQFNDIALKVHSYGEVMAQEQTELVAQVSGQVIELADKFVKGGFVNKGDVLARIDPNDYEAALIEAQAALAQAQASLEIERAQAHVAKSEWDRIKDSANSVIPSELYLRKPQLAEKLASFKAAQAKVKRAKRNLERTYIKAPFDALVTAKSVSLGSVVNMGSMLGQVDATDVAKVRLPVPNSELQYLNNGGLNAPVTLTSTVAGKPIQWQGTIVRNEGVVDKRSRMTYLVAYVEQPYSQATPLRFGAYTTATIEGKTLKNAARIDNHLIKNGKVAVLNSDNTLTFKAANVVRVSDGTAFVTDSLQSGEQLITSALEYPSEGMRLRLDNQAAAVGETQLALKKD